MAAPLDRFLPEMRAYARAIAAPGQEADDLVHDAVERALRAQESPDGARSTRSWLFRIIRNLSIDESRRRRVRETFRDMVESVGVQRAPDLVGDLALRRALDGLPPAMRDAVICVDVLGLTYEEASKRLKTPPGTVMSRVSRGRRALLDALTQDHAL